ncbi:two-component system sensor histidine kinase NtrB [Paenibacillus sp. FA6]|uniref:two-component system sensor histidine kinase NtrB n=1 Tax=Paenibacillus sp. FA6 TaxID=3413029 RepID=UPI003F65B9E0
MVIVISSAVSLMLCSIFSSTLYGVISLNMGIVPLFVAILYGGYKSGLPLATLYITFYFIFTEEYSVSGLLLHTGILMVPVLFFTSASFLKVPLKEKIHRIMICLLPAMLLVIVSPIFLMGNLHIYSMTSIFIMTFYLFISLFCGAMIIYLIEFSFERLLLREQIMGMSEKYLREEDKLQQLMDVAPLCMVSFNGNREVTSINEMMMNLFKMKNPSLTKDDVIGYSVSLFTDLVEKDAIEFQISQALKGMIMEHELTHSDSGIYYTNASPLTNSFTSEIIGAVLVIQDITELERLRSELGNMERLSLVGQMAASITHEIRNPMAVVRGFLQLMNEKSPSSLDHYYRIVMEELDRANGIINDFLSLAQNRVTEKEDYNLHKIIHELSPLLWADANLRGQSIELELEEIMPDLRLNAKEIKQLILNLARNAMEAMNDKGQLTLQTKMNLKSIELIVKDTGPGIPQSKIEKLFVPFFTTKDQGTGLGLVLCMSIVERHKGKIAVHSEEGVGTIFTVSFPRDSTLVKLIPEIESLN